MTARYVPIEEFVSLVEWLISQRGGAARWRFCVFRVAFERPELIGSSFGAQDAIRRLNQFGLTLAAAARRSDVVARKLTVFWVLSPECEPETLGKRLQGMIDSVGEFGLDIVSCYVSAHVFPHPDIGEVADGWQLLDSFDRLSQPGRPAAAPN